MSLRGRLLLAFYSGAFLVVLGGVGAVYWIFSPSYFGLEGDAARSEVMRVETAFMQTLTTLNARVGDWAEADAVVAWVAGERDVTPRVPGADSPDGSGLSSVVLLDEQGERRWLEGEPDQAALTALYNAYQQRFCYPLWGVALFEGQPHLFAMEQVGDCGAVVFTRALDAGLAMELSGLTGLPVELLPEQDDELENIVLSRQADGSVSGDFPVRDYQDQVVMRARVSVDGSAYLRGMEALGWVSLTLVLVAALSVTLVHIYVRRTVFRRLLLLHDTVRRIARGGNLDLHVRVPGNDELSALADDFNQMVDSIKESQHSLAEARERADAANRAKSLFLANMSHEIRTPMTAILGYTELLENPALNQQERERYLSVVQQNGDALMALISDVLDLSRIEAGQMKVERQLCALPLLMKELIYSHTLKAEEKGVALKLDYLTSVPQDISTDPFRLKQILGNLIGNAIKFTDQGEVVVKVRFEEGLQPCLHVAVQDSGIGMSESDLQQVFEPFSQADDSHTRRYGGSGLGLAIARQLVHSMNGDISASSAPGQGSVFSVHVMVAVSPQTKRLLPQDALAEEIRSQQLPAMQVGGRVLLVEDNDVNRLLVQRILSRAGIEVVEATQGEEAVALMEQDGEFDLVILDMQMPVMDGYVAAGAMRDRGYEGPILALTANVMAEDRRRCLAAGCDDFLGKPVRAGRLLAACSRLISRRKRTRAV